MLDPACLHFRLALLGASPRNVTRPRPHLLLTNEGRGGLKPLLRFPPPKPKRRRHVPVPPWCG
jgi:hypothetical protein